MICEEVILMKIKEFQSLKRVYGNMTESLALSNIQIVYNGYDIFMYNKHLIK